MTKDPRASRRPSIAAYPDGPLIVRGEIELVDEEGARVPHTRQTVALCRCGASAIKPWCDGTHKLTGFHTGGPSGAASNDS